MKVNYKSVGIIVVWALFASLVGADVIAVEPFLMVVSVLIGWKLPIFSKR